MTASPPSSSPFRRRAPLRRAFPLAGLLALLLALSACGPGYRTVGVADLHAASEPDRIVLDVRQPYEYAAGHVAGATLLPLPELASRLDEVPADAPVYV